MKLKKGDEVKVIKGKDAGKTAKIARVLSGEQKVLVEGVNQYKRHIKARMQGQTSEIVTITKPLPVANVAFVCPKCKQQTRIGYKTIGTEKVRICRKCEEKI